MGLKRFLKKAVKLGGKIGKPILATTPVGQIALRAQQTLKSLGGNLKAARLGKIEPLSVRGSIEKVAVAGPKRVIRSMPALIRREADSGPERFRRRTISANGSRMPQKRKTANGKGKTLSPSRLRAREKSRAKYAAWKAAGRPGKFFDWAKANR